jgi:hypothetical protein
LAVNRSDLWGGVAALLLALSCLALGLWLRAESAPEWLQPDTTEHPPVLRPWAVETDCYSQLARVQRILQGRGLIQNHFTVENWPEGLIPSTTAPFDYCILLLYAPLRLVTKYPLDWAGALISPLLWSGLIFFWTFFRLREFNRMGRALFLIGAATLPELIWATAFGRPRHQSLILALMAIGLTAEYERWHLDLSPKRAWTILAGMVWGLACWTSLYEPTFVMVVLVAYNLIVRRRESPAFLISYGAVMLVALLVEGVHIFVPPPEYRVYLANWLGTIAEMQRVEFGFLVWQLTLVLLALPFVAWGLLRREGNRRTDGLLVLLTFLLIVLTAFQLRWTYYASLGELFLIVRFCQIEVLRWSRLVVIAIFLVGLADSDITQLQYSAQAPPNQPSVELKQIARSIDQPGGILGPWWLSPGLLYFSGQPIVTGSSHCGISGNVAGAKFFTAKSWIDAERILKERQVRWVVIIHSGPEEMGFPYLNVERGILGLPDYTEDTRFEAASTVEQILAADHFVPTSLQLRCVTPQLLLYEYVPVAGH